MTHAEHTGLEYVPCMASAQASSRHTPTPSHPASLIPPIPPTPLPHLTYLVHTSFTQDKTRLKALMQRYGGHPYETGDMIPFKLLDPAAPLSENLAALGCVLLHMHGCAWFL